MDKEKRGLLTDYDDGATPRRHNKTSSTPGSLNVLGKKKFAYNTKTTTEREQLYRYSRAPAPGSEDETEGDYIDLKRSARRFATPSKRRYPGRLAESLDQDPSFSIGFYRAEEEPATEEYDHEDKDDFDCLVSRTTLLLPLKWSSPLNADIKNWVRHLLERKIVSAKDEEIYLWKTTDKLPFEAGDLDPGFRRLVGWKDESWDAPEFKIVNIMEDYFESVKLKQKEKPSVKLERTRSHGSVLVGGINTTKGDVLQLDPEWEEHENNEDDAITDTCQRLELTPEARNLLFSNTKLCAIHHEDGSSPTGAPAASNTNTEPNKPSEDEQDSNTNANTAPNPNGFNIAPPPSVKRTSSVQSDTTNHDNEVSCHIEVTNVDIWVFPLGTAILMFHINWLHNGQKMTLDELRTWLFLSKFTYKVPGVFSGWNLHNEAWSNLEYSDAHYRSLGRKLIGSIYEGRTLSLRALGNWLLCGRREDPEDPPKRLSRYQKRAYHHSVIVIDREPNQEQINEYLFHLRRAYGQRNRPQSLVEQGTIDRVLIQRQNRYIALSRVGTVSLSWPSGHNNKFEVEQWHKKFLGIYLMLALHVHGEKSMLLELSNLSAASGQLLRQVTHASLQEMSRYRKQLIELATLMTRYTLQMSSDDCGGLSEYVEFFTAMRDIFSIKSQRGELREEIQEVMALVDSNYLEEQRKLRNIERNHRDREEHRRKLTEQAHLIHQSRFERMIAAVSSFTLPLVIVSGMFGMNNEDLPVNWSFWPLIGVTLCLSFLMLFLVLCLSRRVKPTELELMKPERERK